MGIMLLARNSINVIEIQVSWLVNNCFIFNTLANNAHTIRIVGNFYSFCVSNVEAVELSAFQVQALSSPTPHVAVW